jgi:hypothetical protein
MLFVAAFQVIVLGFVVDECLGCFPIGGSPACGLLAAREVKFNVKISYIILCHNILKQHMPATVTKSIKRC